MFVPIFVHVTSIAKNRVSLKRLQEMFLCWTTNKCNNTGPKVV